MTCNHTNIRRSMLDHCWNIDSRHFTEWEGGHVQCLDCKYVFDPLIYNFLMEKFGNGFCSYDLQHQLHKIGHFTDWHQNKKVLEYCMKEYWKAMKNSGYQPPHFDHEPTEAEMEQEEKWQLLAENNHWLATQYAQIIAWIMGVI